MEMEIKSTELRIGNYLGSIHELLIVDSIHDYCAYVNLVETDAEKFIITKNNNFVIKEVLKFADVIPITEEWLIKLGFILTSDGHRKEYQLADKAKNWFMIDTADNGIMYNYHIDCKLKYIHELQNLYYALTKDELVLAAAPPCP